MPQQQDLEALPLRSVLQQLLSRQHRHLPWTSQTVSLLHMLPVAHLLQRKSELKLGFVKLKLITTHSLFGGLMTSYTTGGTTVVATVASPTAQVPTASAAADAIKRAVIGLCPQADSLVIRTDVNTSDLLVACGRAYNGTVLRQYTRRHIPAADDHLTKRATGQDCAVRSKMCILFLARADFRISRTPVQSLEATVSPSLMRWTHALCIVMCLQCSILPSRLSLLYW